MPDETAAGEDAAVLTMFGPYRLDALIGHGGMGEVYRAHHVGQQRTVALKLLRSTLSAEEEYRERFLRESRIMARLTEPHVIPVHGWGEIAGRLYIDMRLVDGDDLGHVLAEGGPLPPSRAVGILVQIAQALDAAHQTGVVHRDVKPSNILLAGPRHGAPRDDDFVYLVDFGVARATSDAESRLTNTGTVLGTFGYIAPERLREEPVDRRADVYSLGCLFFECLTGHRPFVALDPAALMAAHLFQTPPRPSDHRAGVPGLLDAVVARAMAKDPADRYPTAGALASAARAALGTGDEAAAQTYVPAPPISVPAAPPSAVPRRRSYARVLSIGAVALALSAVLLAVIIPRIDARPAAPPPSASAAATPSPEATPSLTEPDRRLLGILPTGFSQDNCVPAPDAQPPTVTAAVRCTGGPADGPTSAAFVRFGDAGAMDQALISDADARSLRIDSGTCRDGDPVRTTWMKDGKVAGLLACYTDQTIRTLRWTDRTALAMGMISRSDNDIATLYDWWTRYDFG